MSRHTRGAGRRYRWDFSWLDGRVRTQRMAWSYDDLAAEHLATAQRVLDIDTGGGELLARLLGQAVPSPGQSWPRRVIASEGWAPNVPVAADRLVRLGVTVLAA